MNILVVRLSAMGDILHTLPAVATLKHSFPAAHIAWAVKPRWSILLRDNPYVDKILPMEWPKPGLGKFDLAIDFQGLIKSSAVARLAGAPRVFGFNEPRETPARVFYTAKVATRARHVVEMNLELAAAAGAARRRIDFPVPDCPPEGELPGGDFVLASPLAGWKAKQWPAACYTRLAALVREHWGWPLVLNCAPSEEEEMAAIPGCLVNATSVAGLIGVTRRARAVVGLDSGPLHLAAALAKPGVALFGPTDPDRNGPYGDTITVLRAAGAVTSYQRDAVIAPSMEALEPEQVWQALAVQISRTSVLEPHL